MSRGAYKTARCQNPEHLNLDIQFFSFTAIHSPQLASLRNDLWTGIFRLFSALLSRARGFEAVRDALSVRGAWPYFTALAAAVQDDSSTDLRYSALTSLTSLLSHEIGTRSLPEESRCVRNLLDGYFPVPKLDRDSTRLFPFGHTRCDEREDVLQDGELVAPESESHSAPRSAQEQLSPAGSKSQCDSGTSEAGHGDHLPSSEQPGERLVGAEMTACGTAGKRTVGEALCTSLLCLYEVHALPQGSRDKSSSVRARNLVTSALSSLLAVSGGAKRLALKHGLLEMLVVQLRELHIKLSVESAENLRRKSEKGKVSGLRTRPFPVA
jgi:hypothetical protein